MFKKLAIVGVVCLVVLDLVAGASEFRLEERDAGKGKEPEKEKKPIIVKDYVCLRDGELCHPDFKKNRGKYITCSHGVAFEQDCPKCGYHPLTCPTKQLWFDGEKGHCEWASPALASQPCIDRFPSREDDQQEKDSEGLLQSLQSSLLPYPMREEQNKWPANPMSSPASVYFKTQLSEAADHKIKEYGEAPFDMESDSEFSSMMPQEGEFPSYLSPEDSAIGSKIVRMTDPVYTLINNPDGSGKQLLQRVYQTFVMEADPGRSLLYKSRRRSGY